MNETDKPPSKGIMDISTGVISTPSSFSRRFKDIWGLWSNDWDIPPIRSSLHRRCLFIFDNLQRK